MVVVVVEAATVEAEATENRTVAVSVKPFMRLRLPVLLIPSVVALFAAPAVGASSSTDDPLGCAATVFDPADHVDDSAIAQQISSAERSLDADVRVRIETAIDGDMDARIEQLIDQCPGWSRGEGELDDELIILMFSPLERESALYYGGYHADVLEDGWESVVDAMTSDLRAGDYEGAVETGMLRLTTEAAMGSDEGDGGGGSDFPAGWLVLLVIVVGITWAIQHAKRSNGDYAGDDGGFWSSGSTSRRRSFSSWSSSGSSRSSGGGSSRSSSGGSRSSGRAGGGSKKW